MSLPLSAEQQQLKETLRSWFAEHYPLTEVRKVFVGEREPLRFSDIAELGLQEAFAGVNPTKSTTSADGWGLRELGIVAFEVGFALAPAHIHLGLWQAGHEALRFSAGDSSVSFTGDTPNFDRSKSLDRTQTVRLVPPGSCSAESPPALALLANEAAGVCAKAIEMTKEYVTTRKQFGKPIGSFQAVQHKLADLFLTAEALRATAEFACWAGGHSPTQMPLSAASAATLANQTVCRVVEGCIQLHGGIGFTWEHDLHLFLRRAKVLELVLKLSGHREDVLLAGRDS